jgi:hypothetical protein
VIDREKMLAELVEVYKRIGYSTDQATARAQRHIERATID